MLSYGGHQTVQDSELDFETLAAQAGLKVRIGDTVSTAPPIDPSTTFTYDSVDAVHAALTPDARGFAYARNANPTVVALEHAMAALEGSEDVVAFGSGMAAVHAVLVGMGLETGDSVVAARDLYGVSRSLLVQLASFGIETHFVNALDLGAVDEALSQTGARLLFFETVSNPLLRVADVAGLAAAAHRHRALAAVDNTFATPYLLRPRASGADIVVHSATKYLAGHGDVVAGLVATSRSLGQRIRDARTLNGGVLSPFEAWLTLRGIRTLPLRMERHCRNALELAGWLHGQPWVRRVHYPGLPDHPQRALAAEQLRGRYGGMVAFELVGDQASTLSFLNGLRLITPGTSLGDVESLVLYPALSSHRTLTLEERSAAGIGDTLVRLSVGIESVRDLERDLHRAATAAGLLQARSQAVPS